MRSGKVQTPFFMPVATFASGRGIGPSDYASCQVQTTISNAFLLSLRPGVQTVEKMGGLAKFMGFAGATFTDSGGFQSSNKELFIQASRNGIHLRSPFDGKTIVMTPKRLIAIQESLGSDVAMVIDDMAPPDSSQERFAKALERTHRWAKECKDAHTDKRQLLFAIVQGGYSAELRRQSAELLTKLDFDGYGIGGCAIGETKEEMYTAIRHSTPFLPEDKPRYLMGVGSPPDIVKAVSLGVDCFDSIFPTRNARHNMIFTWHGSYQVEKAAFALDDQPLEEGCPCSTCQRHTRAYIRHLSTVHEAEGMRLRQVHNIFFMMTLMQKIRATIRKGTYEAFYHEFMRDWFSGKVPAVYASFE